MIGMHVSKILSTYTLPRYYFIEYPRYLKILKGIESLKRLINNVMRNVAKDNKEVTKAKLQKTAYRQLRKYSSKKIYQLQANYVLNKS